VYVAGLVAALQAYKFECAVAVPGKADAAYVHDDVRVFRFSQTSESTLASAYGEPDEDAAHSFRAVLTRFRPRIVHIHARTAAVSERLVEVAREVGAKVVFTYHTPTASCTRGTMMRLGRIPCDGRLEVFRCAACMLQSHGVPPILRETLAAAPQVLGDSLERVGLAGGAFTALRMSALVGANHHGFRRLLQMVDRIVAVCGWVADVLRVNGVPDTKLTICRQAVSRSVFGGPSATSATRVEQGALRLGYFGRLEPNKGVDLLIEALRRVPQAIVRLDIYGVRQPGSEAYAASLESAALADPRISMRAAVRPDAVVNAMRACDLVVVPSRHLETGPLVVLESFAAKTPVLGARLGGIAELVTNGVDGVLVPPDDPAAWSSAIAEFAANPERIRRLRAGVRPPRVMDDVAREMAALYRTMLDHDTH
jgi:glycosyltransferase involved in cell wall biosynthesis